MPLRCANEKVKVDTAAAKDAITGKTADDEKVVSKKAAAGAAHRCLPGSKHWRQYHFEHTMHTTGPESM